MKCHRSLSIGILLMFAVASASAQPGTTTFPNVKVAVVHTDAMDDEKTGITRLVSAVREVNAKYQKQSNELNAMRERIANLEKEITANQSTWQQQMLTDKIDQLERNKRQFQFEGEGLKQDYEKALHTATEPIYRDIGSALMTFAKARGIDILIDASKFAGALMVVNNAVDLTEAFVKDYNGKNAGIPMK